MHNKLILPNKHRLDFEMHLTFKKGFDSKYYQIYIMPALLTEKKEVVPDLEHIMVFRLDDLELLPREDGFFERESSLPKSVVEQAFDENTPTNYEEACALNYDFKSLIKLGNRLQPIELLKMAVNESFENLGYSDLLVGYYDENLQGFVQGVYIEDFVFKETYSILDYYFQTLSEEFYISEDLLDFRTNESKQMIEDKLLYPIEDGDLVSIVEKMKLSCIESSFHTNVYQDEVNEMQQEVLMVYERFFTNITDQNGYRNMMMLSTYLKSLGVVDFYVLNDRTNMYIPIDELFKRDEKEQKQTEINMSQMRIVFHNRLRKMLNDNYG